MSASSRDTAWERLRYGPLLRAAGRSPVLGRAYAAAVAEVELRRDPVRRTTAETRIARWLGKSRDEATRIFRASLRSEAQEEADSARFMHGDGDVASIVDLSGTTDRRGRPRVYGALHFGSPVLAFLGLRALHEPDVRVLARALDERNPMSDAKHAFALRKVAWVERVSGAPFFETDETSILEARAHLLAGRPLFAAIDVPGDVVDRSNRVTLCGESIVLASGLFRLAAMAGADLQLVVSWEREGRIVATCRPPVDGRDARELEAHALVEMEEVLCRWPEEWWFWPFVFGGSGAD